MKLNRYLTAGASVVAIAAMGSFASGASAKQVLYPHGNGVHVDINRPVVHVGPREAPYVAPYNSGSGTWTDVKGTLPFTNGPWGPMQMTDGTILVQDFCTSPGSWYRLTPDKKGNYVNGTWKETATMPSGYSPLFFAQQVLPDGRVMINGGEYNYPCSGGDWTNKGALYDPVKNSWTSVAAPAGWSTIGDAESIVLANGTYMLANCCDSPGFNALASIKGTNVTWTTQKSFGYNDEEPFIAMPGGDVMSVDVWNHTSTSDDTWLYSPAAGTWAQGQSTSCYLSDASTFELGPAALRPDGTVIVFGDNSSCNSLYTVSTGAWTNAPNFGNGYDAADAPAATLPDGNVLVQASPGVFNSPSHFFEYSIDAKGNQTLTKVSDTKEAPNTSSFEGNLLVLPTGQVLWDNSQVSPNEVAVYTPKGKAKRSWRPVVKSVSASLSIGSTGNAISGKNFNGFSLGGVYGDDAQAATNFPIVRITNTGTGDVCFGRSYNFSTMGVWTKGSTKAEFDIPNSCESGASTLQVIVNGIASTGTSVTLS